MCESLLRGERSEIEQPVKMIAGLALPAGAGTEVEAVVDRLAATIGSHQGGRPTEVTADLRDPIGLTEVRTQTGLGILIFGLILPTPLTVDATAGTSSAPITLRLAKCQRTRAGLEIGT
jgi:hypothetical protein